MVEEIFVKYAISNKDDGLNFEEWCEWFTSLEGISEMLTSSGLQNAHVPTRVNKMRYTSATGKK